MEAEVKGDAELFDVYETSMKPIGNCVCLDSTDLVNCQLPVKKVFYDDEESEKKQNPQNLPHSYKNVSF